MVIMGVICEQVQDVAELGEAADDDARRNQLRFRDLIRVGFKTFSKLRITLTGQMHIHKHIMILVCRRAVIGRRCDSRKPLQRGRNRRRRRRRYLGCEGHGVDDDCPGDRVGFFLFDLLGSEDLFVCLVVFVLKKPLEGIMVNYMR